MRLSLIDLDKQLQDLLSILLHNDCLLGYLISVGQGLAQGPGLHNCSLHDIESTTFEPEPDCLIEPFFREAVLQELVHDCFKLLLDHYRSVAS